MKKYADLSITCKTGVTPQDLVDAEQLLGVQLDSQYKELFQLVNAPEFGEWLFYPVKDKRNLRKTFDDIVRNTKIARESGLPEAFVVIAENGTGDFLCMRSGQPQVYYQNHEQDSAEVIANDLKAFIERVA
ncbi:SMI1/KNR4 family protein [Listeria booriae]|uniref:SMI1/KNR4 family protein n=1 Tax=Listeria booriae TaxID=1552123 RepID=A0A841Y9G7_9LIST|nr:SMI1/KNR4 family protein [Listeria booriae]MBC1373555.1 SMI1/KNR4 family protein [Listeria booriae]